MVEPWHDLRIGDHIRLVAMPSEFAQPDYHLHPRTRRVHERLIARRRPVRVCRIDELGLPWIDRRFRERNGNWGHHSLAFDHDGWVRVRGRSEPSLQGLIAVFCPDAAHTPDRPLTNVNRGEKGI